MCIDDKKQAEAIRPRGSPAQRGSEEKHEWKMLGDSLVAFSSRHIFRRERRAQKHLFESREKRLVLPDAQPIKRLMTHLTLNAL